MKHRTAKKNAIDKKTKKYNGGKRGYRSKRSILTNNKTKKGGSWLSRQFKKVSIAKTLNLLFIYYCIQPFANERATQMPDLRPQARVQSREDIRRNITRQIAQSSDSDEFHSVNTSLDTIEQMVEQQLQDQAEAQKKEEEERMQYITPRLDVLNWYIKTFKICSSENKTLQRGQDPLYFMDSNTVCKYFYNILGLEQGVPEEYITYELEYDENNKKNVGHWANLYRYIKPLLFDELLPYWKEESKKNENGIVNIFENSIINLLFALKMYFSDNFYSVLESNFSNQMKELLKIILLTPQELRDLVKNYKYNNKYLKKSEWGIPQSIKLEIVLENNSSKDRYLPGINYDMQIFGEPMKLSLFTLYIRNGFFPYQFNEITFKNIYSESFERTSPILIYYNKKLRTNSPLKQLFMPGTTDPDIVSINKSYNKMFRMLETISAFKTNSENPINKLQLPSTIEPIYSKFHANLHVKRIVSLCTILNLSFTRYIFGPVAPDEIGVFNKDPRFNEENDDAYLCNMGMSVLPQNTGDAPFEDMRPEIKSIYDNFLQENISIKGFDYDTLTNNDNKQFLLTRIIDFDNDCAYGILFCKIKYTADKINMGFCIQLITAKNIFDENHDNATVDVKLLVIWRKLSPDDIATVKSYCPIMFTRIINPIQYTLIDNPNSYISQQYHEIVPLNKSIITQLTTPLIQEPLEPVSASSIHAQNIREGIFHELGLNDPQNETLFNEDPNKKPLEKRPGVFGVPEPSPPPPQSVADGKNSHAPDTDHQKQPLPSPQLTSSEESANSKTPLWRRGLKSLGDVVASMGDAVGKIKSNSMAGGRKRTGKQRKYQRKTRKTFR